MGRHFEVRAKAMEATAKKKSAIYMRASKEIYIAAKQGTPDPDSNLALRSAIDKYKSQGVPKDVIERAIKKAAGGEQEAYIAGRYEFFGPGGSLLIVDSLTDNPNRALVEIKTAIVRKGGHMANVLYNFEEKGLFAFNGAKKSEVEEALILNDVDVTEVTEDDGEITVLVAPHDFSKARDILTEQLGVKDFLVSEIQFIPNEKITLSGEDLEKFTTLIDTLEELQDVQAIYHNVQL